MSERIQYFSQACKKLPKQLKDSDAYAELKKEIDDFTEVWWCESRASQVLIKHMQLRSQLPYSRCSRLCIVLQVLPLLEELSKRSIMPRHWKQVEELTGKPLHIENEMTRLQTILDADLLQYKVCLKYCNSGPYLQALP